MLASVALSYVAYSRRSYFASEKLLGGLILLEVLVAAVWMYRRLSFPAAVIAFLLAGVNLPVGVWTVARWLFLDVGAIFGARYAGVGAY